MSGLVEHSIDGLPKLVKTGLEGIDEGSDSRTEGTETRCCRRSSVSVWQVTNVKTFGFTNACVVEGTAKACTQRTEGAAQVGRAGTITGLVKDTVDSLTELVQTGLERVNEGSNGGAESTEPRTSGRGGIAIRQSTDVETFGCMSTTDTDVVESARKACAQCA